MRRTPLRDVRRTSLLHDALGICGKPEAQPDELVALPCHHRQILGVAPVQRVQRRATEPRVVTDQDAQSREFGVMRDRIRGRVTGCGDVEEWRSKAAERVPEPVPGDGSRAGVGHIDSGGAGRRGAVDRPIS